MDRYVHGYSEREGSRLHDQAKTLSEILHSDTRYEAGTAVLEAGCGVGSQTVILAKNNPDVHFISVDISDDSLAKAKAFMKSEGITNVEFHRADIFKLTYEESTFDHVFVCFVLEHLAEPVKALGHLNRVLKPGGSITVIEGDHGSAFFHPDSWKAQKTIQCLIDLQAEHGNSLIGRRLYPILCEAGFVNPSVSARMIYADSGKPGLVEGFTKNTFIAMVEGVRQRALEAEMIDSNLWEEGIADLYKTAGEGGTFCYTFFKGMAYKR